MLKGLFYLNTSIFNLKIRLFIPINAQKRVRLRSQKNKVNKGHKVQFFFYFLEKYRKKVLN